MRSMWESLPSSWQCFSSPCSLGASPSPQPNSYNSHRRPPVLNTLRMLVLLSGAALLVIAVTYLLLTQALAPFTIPVAAIVIAIGLKLAPSPKVTGGQLLGGGPLIVDRAVLGVSIYQLFFFDTRLILKRLATAKTTICTVLVLSLAGLDIERLIVAL